MKIKLQRDHAKTLATARTLDENYRGTIRGAKRSYKVDKKNWLETGCQEAEQAASRNDSRTLLRISTSTDTIKSMPIKSKTSSVLSSEEEKNQRWVEHFSEVLDQPSLDLLFDFTNENDIDGNNSNIILDYIIRDEFTEAIKTLKNNKASGIDNLPAELFENGGDVIIEKLTELGIVIWSSEEVPNEWTKGGIVKLPKKGSLCDCNNWRGITLLTIVRKTFCRK